MKENMMNERKDLVLEKNTVIEGDLVCNNIYGKDGNIFDLTVRGDIKACNIKARNINAWDIKALDINAGNIKARDIDACDIRAWDIKARNINAWDIKALDIDAGNIKARDIDAWNIKAWDIDAYNIICVSRTKKSENNKTIAFSLVLDRFNRKRKEY